MHESFSLFEQGNVFKWLPFKRDHFLEHTLVTISLSTGRYKGRNEFALFDQSNLKAQG